MILHENLYLQFISKHGVGEDSCASYISYLNSVSKLIGEDIGPEILKIEVDVIRIKRQLESNKSSNNANTIRNYCSAMRQYVAFVESVQLGLCSSKTLFNLVASELMP